MKRMMIVLPIALACAGAIAAEKFNYLFEFTDASVEEAKRLGATKTVVWYIQPSATGGFGTYKWYTYNFVSIENWAYTGWPNYIEFQNADGIGVRGYFIAAHTNELRTMTSGTKVTVNEFDASKHAPAELDRWMKRNGHIPRPRFYANGTKVIVK